MVNKMETTIIKMAMSQGLWAVLSVFLIVYIVKAQEKREKMQEKREKNYQKIIENLLNHMGNTQKNDESLKKMADTIQKKFNSK